MSHLTLDTQSLAYRRRGVGTIMSHVMLALIPGTLVYAWLIDPRLLANVIIAIVSALCLEALFLRLRQRAVLSVLRDGSIALAAWLLALCLPPSLPAWQLIIGVFVMTGLGKHLFGGLGNNPFNPAMVAYAVLIVSFPVTMTHWHGPTSSAPEQRNADTQWDALSGATPLDHLREIRLTLQKPADPSGQPYNQQANQQSTLQDSQAYSEYAGNVILSSHWKWVNLAWLCGGIYLLLARIITWHIPVAMLSTLALLYAAYALAGFALSLPVVPALLSGAIMLGAFFIATDPVSAAASNTGRLIYGAGIGLLTFIIREFSSYPEGIAFAVLLMNTCVPLLDYLLTGQGARSGSARG